MDRRVLIGVAVVAAAVLSGCGGGTDNAARTGPAPRATSPGSGSGDRVVATQTSSPAPAATAATTTPGCRTRDLSLGLGRAEGTAGSVYEPLRFTNTGAGACTLTGYPGVSFVTAGSGDQVGAAASRNPQHAAVTVTLAPGATAEAVVQVVDYMNFGSAQCRATAVSGFRVYPPGETAAAFVPFDHPSNACSTHVDQLTVEAVAAAS